jgi:hypothetical protein
MFYNVIHAEYVRDYVVRLKFEDGTAGEVDLANELWGEVFVPLKDVAYFRRFEVAEYGTLTWPNGADIAPEFLYEHAYQHATAR